MHLEDIENISKPIKSIPLENLEDSSPNTKSDVTPVSKSKIRINVRSAFVHRKKIKQKPNPHSPATTSALLDQISILGSVNSFSAQVDEFNKTFKYQESKPVCDFKSVTKSIKLLKPILKINDKNEENDEIKPFFNNIRAGSLDIIEERIPEAYSKMKSLIATPKTCKSIKLKREPTSISSQKSSRDLKV